jgi:predicted amidohydrolase YtcJ
MDEPFTNNPAKSGLASPDLLDVEHFYESMRQADKAGLQLTIHSIGDRANRTILDLYGRLEKTMVLPIAALASSTRSTFIRRTTRASQSLA